MTRTAADYMAQALAQAGVKRIYGVVGDSLNGFTDSLRRLQSIEWIHVRHEEATHPESLVKECSHYAELVSHPEQLPQVLLRAMRVAVGQGA